MEISAQTKFLYSIRKLLISDVHVTLIIFSFMLPVKSMRQIKKVVKGHFPASTFVCGVRSLFSVF